MTMRKQLVLPLALAAAALPLLAQQPAVQRGEIERQGRVWVQTLNCSAPVRPGGRLVLRADQGSVEVKPAANDRFTCNVRVRVWSRDEQTARRLLRGFQLDLRPLSEGGISLQGRTPHSPRHMKVEYQVQAPRRFNLDLETGGGNLRVAELDGALQAVTAGGDIEAGDISGLVRAETAGGNISFANVGQRFEARTAGGNIRVGDVAGDAEMETSGGEILVGRIQGTGRAVTAGGDIILRSATADIVAETAGGQIRIGAAGAGLRAETAGGNIVLDAGHGLIQVETAGGCIYLDGVDTAVQAATAAGTIRALITANAQSFGASFLETSYGDVQVYLPNDLPLTIDAAIENAAGHKILSDFPLKVEGAGPHYHAQTVEARGALNGGGQVLRLRTIAGNIEIRRLDKATVKKQEQKKKSLWERLFEWDEDEHKH
jgi:DUF4097 and DUF4098 domain-containing protein YvlB